MSAIKFFYLVIIAVGISLALSPCSGVPSSLEHSLIYVKAERDECPTSSSATTTVKLRNAILCDYDATVRPVVTHQNATSVYFKFILKYFLYDVTTSTLSLDAWMPIYWKDEHLKWKPEEYENIAKIHLHTSDIWTPDLSVFNRASEGGDPTALGSVNCAVTSKGSILCVPSIHIDALCAPNLSMYPFDVQRCALRMGSWIYKGEELDIKLSRNVLVMEDVEPNGEWEIFNYTAVRHAGNYKCCPNSTYPSVEIVFNLRRLAGAHAASVVIPSVVAIILTFTSLSLSPLDKDRLVLCFVNVIVQFMHVQYMSWQVPLKGDKIPLLLLFARDSLLLAVFVIVFTIINKKIMQRGTAAPTTVSVIVSGIIGNRVGQFIFLDNNSVRGVELAKGEEDSDAIIKPTTSEPSTAWDIFGRLLDFILLIIYIIVYFTMLMKFLP